MDRELASLHHNAGRERWNDTNPGPLPDVDPDTPTCEWGDCDSDASTTRPGFNRRLQVCHSHRRHDPRPEPRHY